MSELMKGAYFRVHPPSLREQIEEVELRIRRLGVAERQRRALGDQDKAEDYARQRRDHEQYSIYLRSKLTEEEIEK